ncbi:hypothetical protein [Aquimarina sp. 2201CG5-10]|uniref:hypothetical protein n=1 Tax=Aquimarina callyspongiae TaxID=3098150 RepID=UPI002AB414DF|nr:hypothetical protein [Aquimarina sp. 2201CG5-10]MDY8135569.1 hypothetical protein [Aquimarina sp. 2201CG5-10]
MHSFLSIKIAKNVKVKDIGLPCVVKKIDVISVEAQEKFLGGAKFYDHDYYYITKI